MRKNTVKRIIPLVVCSLVLCSLLSGCGKRKAINNYPGMEPVDIEEAANENKDGSVDEAKYSDGKVFYMARGQHGESVYRVDAEVAGDPADTYPVYDLKYWNMNTADLYSVSAFLIGARDAEYLLPIELADEDYLANRLDVLEKRRDQLLEKGKEVSHALTTEIDEIHEAMNDPNLANKFTLPSPRVPEFNDLHDFYEAKYGVDVDLQFMFAENVSPEGDVLRLDVIRYRGNTTLKLYTVDYNYDDSNNYYLGSSEKMLPVSFDNIDGKACEELGSHLLEAMDIGGYICTKTLPACDFGRFTDVPGEHSYEKPAYCSFYSLGINGRTRPSTDATSFFSHNTTSSSPVVSAENITTIFAQGEDVYSYGEYTIPANDAIMYDSICICIGENDKAIEIYVTNIIRDVVIKTEKAQLLPFVDADACAQKYLAYLAAHESPGYEVTINRIELGMCRALGETGAWYMVPAWYYLEKTSEDNPLQKPIMAVNAIDGSIIDVQAGGTTKTF